MAIAKPAKRGARSEISCTRTRGKVSKGSRSIRCSVFVLFDLAIERLA